MGGLFKPGFPVAALHFVGALFAQSPLDPATGDGRKVLAFVNKAWSEPSGLTCTVSPLRLEMGFSFRIVAGFRVVIPAAQFPGRQSQMVGALRISPRSGGGPFYFWERFMLPEESKRRQAETIAIGGGVNVGPGVYKAEWVLVDDTGHSCRSEWSITAKARSSQSALKPGVVEAIGLETWRGLEPQSGEPRRTATVFLHAAPIWRRRNFVQLSSWDRMMLQRSLTALLDNAGFGQVRLVAFDAIGKRVLFQTDVFDQNAYRRLAQILRTTNYGTVDYKVLTEGPQESQLMANILTEDRKREKPSDTVVFLGPELSPAGKMTPALLEVTKELPKTYYLALSRMPVHQGDVIQKIVKASKGKLTIVQRPQDLLKPIRAIAEGR